jgi:hypothetical protein
MPAVVTHLLVVRIKVGVRVKVKAGIRITNLVYCDRVRGELDMECRPQTMNKRQ